MASFTPRARLLSWPLAAAIGMLSSSAFAQSAGGGVTSADHRIQLAYQAWRKRSQTEVDCIDQSLRARGSSVRQLIQRGVWPSDDGLASVRAACRTREKSNATAAKDAGKNAGNALAASEGVVVKTTETPVEKIPAQKSAPEKVVAEAAPAVEPATVEAVAAERAAEKLAAEKAVADKAAAEKAAAEKAAAEKATKVAAEKAAAEKAAALDKAAAEKVAAEKAAAEQAAAEREFAEKAAAAIAAAKADVRAGTDDRALGNTVAQAPAERSLKDAERAIAELTFTLSAAEAKVSFMYGLMTGLGLAGAGIVAFFVLVRWWSARMVQSEALPQAVPPRQPESAADVDRLIAAVLASQKRPDRRTSPRLDAPERRAPADVPAPV